MEELMLLESVEGLKTKNDKDYTRLVFIKKDHSKMIANIWDTKVEDFKYEPIKVYKVNYTEEDYKGNIQMKDVTLSLSENQDLSDFVKKAPIDTNEIKLYIYKIYNSITYSPFRLLIEKMLNKSCHGNTFWTQTASKKVHENYTGGLAYHTYKMLKIAESILETGIYECNKDILYTAIIIHDMGKIAEYSSPVGTELTKVGELIGHIPLAYSWIREFMLENGINEEDERFMLLSHCLLSHHGKLEYGSPVLPKTAEAILLNQIDMMDSRMAQIVTAKEETEPGDFSRQVFSLGVKVYKNNIEN